MTTASPAHDVRPIGNGAPGGRNRAPWAGDTAGQRRYRGQHRMAQAVTRAVLLCQDAGFRQFLGAADEVAAAAELKRRLGIKSRREIRTDMLAFEAFRDLEYQFAVSVGRAAAPR
jgi:hypothetical protein